MEKFKNVKEYSVFEILPTGISGLMLALFALGNMLKSISEYIRYSCGILGFLLFLMLIIKALFYYKNLEGEFRNVAIASVMPTFSMGTMILGAYILPFNRSIGILLWYAAILIHIILMVLFTKKYIINFKTENVLPSWYIVYVGIATASLTGKSINPALAQHCFYFGLISYLILTPIILNRVYRVKEIIKPDLPTKVIMAAPGSLCLAGYLVLFEHKSIAMVVFLLVISQFLYILVLKELPSLLKLSFYPSFSAFTFPTVITAFSLKLSAKYFLSIGINLKVVNLIVIIEEALAIALCLYVGQKYAEFVGERFRI